MEPNKLLRIEDCETLNIDQVWGHYRQYVNAGQVELIASFGFGRDVAVSAEGVWIETQSGRRILDFTGGMGVLTHGHNHPRILAARAYFAERKMMEVHKNFFSPYLAALSHNIAQLLPADLNISYFANSGAEAVEGALKLAYKYHNGQRAHVLHSDISYHGKLLGAGSVSASRELHFRYPEIPHCHAFEYGNLGAIKALVDALKRPDGASDVYAIIIEPMSASSLRACSASFLADLRAVCDAHDIVLIFDEVFTGWAKTGPLFYFMDSGVLPDILVTSKALGGGKASISAYVARKPVFDQAYGRLADATLHSTTYNGFGEECVTALEAINILVDDDYVGRVRRIGDLLGDGLAAIGAEFPQSVAENRGCGALQGLLLATGPAIISKLAQAVPVSFAQDDRFLQKLVTAAAIYELYETHGVLTYFAENQEIILMAAPAAVATDEEVAQFLAALRSTLGHGLIKLCLRFIASKAFAKFMTTVGAAKSGAGVAVR